MTVLGGMRLGMRDSGAGTVLQQGSQSALLIFFCRCRQPPDRRPPNTQLGNRRRPILKHAPGLSVSTARRFISDLSVSAARRDSGHQGHQCVLCGCYDAACGHGIYDMSTEQHNEKLTKGRCCVADVHLVALPKGPTGGHIDLEF